MSAGGIAIILSIVTILVFISLEAIPLWDKVESRVSGSFKLNKNQAIFTSPLINQESEVLYPTPDIIAIGVEEFREIAYLISSNGFVHFISLKDGNNIYKVQLKNLLDKRITSVSGSIGNDKFTIGTDDGFILPLKIIFNVTFDKKQKRNLSPKVIEGGLIFIDYSPIELAEYKEGEEGTKSSVAYNRKGNLILITQEEAGSFFDDSDVQEYRADLTSDLKGNKVTSLVLDDSLTNIYAGTDKGEIFNWDIKIKKTQN